MLLASAVCAVGACGVDLKDVPGRACDEAHPCQAPRACLAGFCFAPSELDAGRPDSGAPDAGAFDAGTPDAGPQPLWQQRLHGFTTTTVDMGCAVDIDPSRGNRVVATIRAGADNQDTATADMVDPARLPKTTVGKLRGRLTLPAPVQVRGLLPVAFLGSQTGTAWVRLAFDAQGRLVVASDANTLGAAPLTEAFMPDGGFTTGDWVVEVAWTRGGNRLVWLNGAPVADTPTGSGATAPPPTELDLGILRYDSDAGTGFSLTLSGWQLADDLGVTLGDVP